MAHVNIMVTLLEKRDVILVALLHQCCLELSKIFNQRNTLKR